jgi:hypothetical protein
MGYAGGLGQYRSDFLPCKHDGHPSRFLGMFGICQRWDRLFEEVTVEEDQYLQRNIVCRSRSLSLHS